MAYRRPNRNIKLFGGAISARTQRIRDKEDDGATNRRDPKEEHAASIKSEGRFYMPIFRIFGTLEKRRRGEAAKRESR